MDKVYTGSMHFGATTPSYDAETKIDNEYDISNITEEILHKTTQQFTGEIEQVPPAFSAIKVDGKRAFKLARKNESVKLKSRKVTVRSFQLLKIDLPRIDFAVECTKGTYIRSLVNDFGKALDKGAYLTGLRRTSIGEYNVNESFTLDEFKEKVLKQIENENAE
jgi:tRNA pseudouridine55 synthase